MESLVVDSGDVCMEEVIMIGWGSTLQGCFCGFSSLGG